MLLPPLRLSHDGLAYLLETNKKDLFLTVELYQETRKLAHQTVMGFDAAHSGRLGWIEFYDCVNLEIVDRDLFDLMGPRQDESVRFLGQVHDKAIDVRANCPLFKSKVLEIFRDTHTVAKECQTMLANKARRKGVEDTVLELLRKPANFERSFYMRDMLTVTIQKSLTLSSKIPKS